MSTCTGSQVVPPTTGEPHFLPETSATNKDDALSIRDYCVYITRGTSTMIAVLSITLLMILFFLAVSLPETTTENTVIEPFNMTAVLTLDPSEVQQVKFEPDMNNSKFAVTFYDDTCSDIETERQSVNYTRSLNVTSKVYQLDTFHLIGDSTIFSLISSPELEGLSTCIAQSKSTYSATTPSTTTSFPLDKVVKLYPSVSLQLHH